MRALKSKPSDAIKIRSAKKWKNVTKFLINLGSHQRNFLHNLSMSSYPCPHISPQGAQISTGRHPIISVLTFPCPNHLNLPHLTTFALLWIPKRLYKTSLRILSFRDTPHIHLTIVRSALSRLRRFSAFIAKVSIWGPNDLYYLFTENCCYATEIALELLKKWVPIFTNY